MIFSPDEFFQRIAAIGGQTRPGSDERSLLHGYVACLRFADLCKVGAMTLDHPVDVRLALRSRLLRLLGKGCTELEGESLVALVEQTAIASDATKLRRPAADALHSAIFGHLPLATQRWLLGRWAGRGTRGAMARWLKATKENPELFDADVALKYWRASKDARAAKSLAYQAPPEMLAQIISELVDVCTEGWIIAQAIIRAGSVEKVPWELISARHPATYLYLCAQLRQPVTEDEAFELVCRCSGIAVDGGRGLAIWAAGQMGMVAVLDRVHQELDILHNRETAQLLARYPQIVPIETPN